MLSAKKNPLMESADVEKRSVILFAAFAGNRMENIVGFGDHVFQLGVGGLGFHFGPDGMTLQHQLFQIGVSFFSFESGGNRRSVPYFGGPVQFSHSGFQRRKVAFFSRVEGGGHDFVEIFHLCPSGLGLLRLGDDATGQEQEGQQGEIQLFHLDNRFGNW